MITPDTPLEDLEEFFRSKGTEFALVTDLERKWVLAVATKTDLEASLFPVDYQWTRDPAIFPMWTFCSATDV